MADILSQREVDTLLAPRREELLTDSPEENKMRRSRLQIMLSLGRTLDDLYAGFVTRFRVIRGAYDRGELNDSEFEEQANFAVQNYLQDRMMGTDIGMGRYSYLVHLAELSTRHDGETLREHAYLALRGQLKRRL